MTFQISMLKHHRLVILTLLLVVQLMTGSGCSNAKRDSEKTQISKDNQKLDEENQRKALRQANKQRISNIKKEYGVSTEWVNSITPKDHDLPVYSFQIQEAFEPLIGKPILLLVSVVDVYLDKTGHHLVCYQSSENSAWGMHFILDLTPTETHQLTTTPSNCDNQVFAVVAVPKHVQVRYDHSAFIEMPNASDLPGIEDITSVESLLLDIEVKTRVSVAEMSGIWIRGACLKLEFLPNYYEYSWLLERGNDD